MAEAQQPGERYWSVVEPFWRAVSIYDGPDDFTRQFSELPLVARHLLTAHWCQSEVRNGGLHQFFSNSTGVLAPEALAAFRAIGLTEWAAILAEAMQFFSEPYPREQADRREQLAGRSGERREEWDPFFALDKRFYKWLHAGRDRWARAADRFAAAQGAAPYAAVRGGGGRQARRPVQYLVRREELLVESGTPRSLRA